MYPEQPGEPPTATTNGLPVYVGVADPVVYGASVTIVAKMPPDVRKMT